MLQAPGLLRHLPDRGEALRRGGLRPEATIELGRFVGPDESAGPLSLAAISTTLPIHPGTVHRGERRCEHRGRSASDLDATRSIRPNGSDVELRPLNLASWTMSSRVAELASIQRTAIFSET